jgi:hypothetical protein
MLITLPLRRSSMCAPTARVQRMASVRLMSMTNFSFVVRGRLRFSLVGQLHQGLADGIAQARSRARRCGRTSASTESTAVRTLSGFVTSATIGSTRRPEALAISAASGSTNFGVSAFSAMSAPAFASTCAMPFPMPRPAPVMKTTFSL